MNFKIDTKDAFYVISPTTNEFTAKLAEELLLEVAKSQTDIRKSLVLNLDQISSIENEAIQALDILYEKTISEKKSFVLCCMTQEIKTAFTKMNLMEKINHTPTESEAWDIIQMEEIERELDIDTE